MCIMHTYNLPDASTDAARKRYWRSCSMSLLLVELTTQWQYSWNKKESKQSCEKEESTLIVGSISREEANEAHVIDGNVTLRSTFRGKNVLRLKNKFSCWWKKLSWKGEFISFEEYVSESFPKINKLANCWVNYPLYQSSKKWKYWEKNADVKS